MFIFFIPIGLDLMKLISFPQRDELKLEFLPRDIYI